MATVCAGCLTPDIGYPAFVSAESGLMGPHLISTAGIHGLNVWL